MGSVFSNDSVTTITSGATVEARTLLWKITQFPVMRMTEPMINSQTFDFDIGSKIGLSSKWTLCLKRQEKSDGKWIGIHYKLKERPAVACPELYSQLSVAIVDKKKRTIANRTVALNIKDVLTLPQDEGWGQSRLIKEDDTLSSLLVDGDLRLLITFKLFCPQPIPNVESALQEFQAKSMAKALKELEGVGISASPNSSAPVKFVSSDGVEMTTEKGILAARNPVFKAMLETKMVEATTRVIKLPCISSQTLPILINFFREGKLLPGWSQPEVTVELTNAAAQYQIDDLLQFLDTVLGRICSLENVMELLNLAKLLSLRVAEAELLGFARSVGCKTSDNYTEMVNATAVLSLGKRKHGDDDAEEDNGLGKKLKVGN